MIELSSAAKTFLRDANIPHHAPAHHRIAAEAPSHWFKHHSHEKVDSRLLKASVMACCGRTEAPDTLIDAWNAVIPGLDRPSSIIASKVHGLPVLVSVVNPGDGMAKTWKKAGLKPEEVTIIGVPHAPGCTKEIALELEQAGLAAALLSPKKEWAVSLTGKGFEYRESLFTFQPEPEPFQPQPIECPVCHEFLLETTEGYNPDAALTGAMIAQHGAARDGNWSLPFGDDDMGEKLLCPGCGGRLCGADGKLKPGALGRIEVDELEKVHGENKLSGNPGGSNLNREV